jgi:cytochrome c5
MSAKLRVLLPAVLALAGPARAEEYPEFEEPSLKLGRAIWMDTCIACHTTDIAGAPQVTDVSAWAPRVRQGKQLLYEHALNGFHGEKGTEMPARGGNPALTDDQVRAAVDYMVALVANLAGEK